MKNIFLLLSLSLLCGTLVSCNQNQTQDKYSNESIPWTTVTEFDYKGHSYIKFGDGYQGGVTHNPNCKCFKDLTSNN